MRLLKIRVKNFRRFVQASTLDVDERLVALVGPNEAGKSSILLALQRLGNPGPLPRSDRTRTATAPCAIQGLFLLEADDLAAVRDELADWGESPVEQVWVDLAEESEPKWRVLGYPHRDKTPREVARAALVALEGVDRLDGEYTKPDHEPWDPQLYVDVIAILASEDETLGTATRNHLNSLAERLEALDFDPNWGDAEAGPEQMEELEEASARRYQAAADLRAVAESDALTHPATRVVNVLRPRLPTIAQFRQEDRVIDGTYSLSTVVEEGPDAHKALWNLAGLADLNLADLLARLGEGRVNAEGVLQRANELLQERVQTTWRQSTVFPKLMLDSDGTLQVGLWTGSSGEYSTPGERSDGLLWFLALHAFLVANQGRHPILLIDEAETHLHYDAQADLVEALMRQEIASKVIYTTHSVGCLPPDLGRGIRAVVPDPDREVSTIANLYWTLGDGSEEKVGHAPLLLGMGASMLALTVPRFAVLAEGPSDAILLPTILRKVAGSPIEYRVVPGLSEVSEVHIPRLRSHAGQVVCLTDGDQAGRDRRALLEDNGVAPGRLFSLDEVSPGLTLEDLVTPEAFAEVVNIEITTWGLGDEITPDVVPETKRMTWIETLGSSFKSLNKNRIAGHLVDLVDPPDERHKRAAEQPEEPAEPTVSIIDERYIDALTALELRIRDALGLAETTTE